MKHTGRKILALIGAVTMAMGLLIGCGEKEEEKVTGTYTCKISTEDLAGNTAHNGYISAIGVSQKNTLELKEDGSYTYTKQVAKFDEAGKAEEDYVNLVFTFTGKYTNEGSKVTLNAPEDCEFNEDWSILNGAGLSSSSGKASNGDRVVCKEDQSHDPLDFFLTEYYVDSEKHDGSVAVTVNADDGTFKYDEVASSDDE